MLSRKLLMANRGSSNLSLSVYPSPFGTLITRKVTFDSGTFVVVGGNNSTSPRLAYSVDGISWTTVSIPTGKGPLSEAAKNNSGYWMAVGYDNATVISSNNLATFVSGTNNFTNPYITCINCDGPVGLAGSKGQLGVVGSTGISTSTMVTQPVGSTNPVNSIKYLNGYYTVVSSVGINLSTSATDWSYTRKLSETGFFGITYGNGVYVAVGESGKIKTSTDLVTWSLQESGTTANLRNVHFENGLFVAVGNYSTVITSTDGTSWVSEEVTTADIHFGGVTYGNGSFVLTGTNGVAVAEY